MSDERSLVAVSHTTLPLTKLPLTPHHSPTDARRAVRRQRRLVQLEVLGLRRGRGRVAAAGARPGGWAVVAGGSTGPATEVHRLRRPGAGARPTAVGGCGPDPRGRHGVPARLGGGKRPIAGPARGGGRPPSRPRRRAV